MGCCQSNEQSSTPVSLPEAEQAQGKELAGSTEEKKKEDPNFGDWDAIPELERQNTIVLGRPDDKTKSISTPVFKQLLRDIKLHYRMGEELGRGGLAVVYRCTNISTGKSYACKSIPKRNLTVKSHEDIRREVQIMTRLRGQPNIVEYEEFFEDQKSVHLVMELCAGGELFDRIVARERYSEKEAASVFRSIVRIIQTCHSNGVMHRDIKPENFMLSSKNVNDSLLKAIDFGYSEFIERGKRFQDVVGSTYYIAPEVLCRNYGKEADIWSAGVMLYILLSGVPPFWAETRRGIFAAVLAGKFDLEKRPWPSISSSAKDLIKKMLTMDANLRITPSQILEHPWLREGGEASDKPIDGVVIVRLKQNRLHSKRFRYN